MSDWGKGVCPVCRTTQKLNKGGAIAVHHSTGRRGTRCNGTDKFPAMVAR